MAATLASLGPVLKNFYEPGIYNEMSVNVAAWKDFDDVDLKWEGDFAIMGLKIGRNQSVQSAAEGQVLNPAGNQVLARLTVQSASVYGSIQLTGQAKAAAASTKGGLATWGQIEMDGLVEDLMKRLNVYTFMGGTACGLVWQKQNGPLTWQYSGRADSATDPEQGIVLVPGVSAARFFRTDSYAEVPGPAFPAATVVTGITTDTLSLAAAINTAGVPIGVPLTVVLELTPSVNTDPRGFIGNLGLQDHFGNDRSAAANARLRSNFRQADPTVGALAPLTPDGLQGLSNSILTRSTKKPQSIWSSYLSVTSYSTLFTMVASGTNARINMGSKDSKYDFVPEFTPDDTSYAYGGMALRASDSCPDSTMFFINKKTWKRASLKKGGWDNILANGQMLPLANVDAETARWSIYYNLVAQGPNANGCITAIALV